MNQAFFLVMNLILIGRLVYVFSAGPLSKASLGAMIMLPVIGMTALHIQWAWWVLLGYIVPHALVFHLIEVKWKASGEVRLLSLVVHVIAVGIFFSPAIGLSLNPVWPQVLASLRKYSAVVPMIGSMMTSSSPVVLFGGLLVLNEANLLVRILLTALRIVDKTARGEEAGATCVDTREYNTGRIIGLLERLLIFAAVLGNQIAAIGLVLAAKGFTRYKEMEDRRFAEYVLIGTLLSTLLAAAMALGVIKMLKTGP